MSAGRMTSLPNDVQTQTFYEASWRICENRSCENFDRSNSNRIGFDAGPNLPKRLPLKGRQAAASEGGDPFMKRQTENAQNVDVMQHPGTSTASAEQQAPYNSMST